MAKCNQLSPLPFKGLMNFQSARYRRFVTKLSRRVGVETTVREAQANFVGNFYSTAADGRNS